MEENENKMNEIPPPFDQIINKSTFNEVQSLCFEYLFNTRENVLITTPPSFNENSVTDYAIAKEIIDKQYNTTILFIESGSVYSKFEYDRKATKYQKISLDCQKIMDLNEIKLNGNPQLYFLSGNALNQSEMKPDIISKISLVIFEDISASINDYRTTIEILFSLIRNYDIRIVMISRSFAIRDRISHVFKIPPKIFLDLTFEGYKCEAQKLIFTEIHNEANIHSEEKSFLSDSDFEDIPDEVKEATGYLSSSDEDDDHKPKENYLSDVDISDIIIKSSQINSEANAMEILSQLSQEQIQKFVNVCESLQVENIYDFYRKQFQLDNTVQLYSTSEYVCKNYGKHTYQFPDICLFQLPPENEFTSCSNSIILNILRSVQKKTKVVICCLAKKYLTQIFDILIHTFNFKSENSEINDYIDSITDKNLKKGLECGIGYISGYLSPEDQAVVNYLHTSGSLHCILSYFPFILNDETDDLIPSDVLIYIGTDWNTIVKTSCMRSTTFVITTELPFNVLRSRFECNAQIDKNKFDEGLWILNMAHKRLVKDQEDLLREYDLTLTPESNILSIFECYKEHDLITDNFNLTKNGIICLKTQVDLENFLLLIGFPPPKDYETIINFCVNLPGMKTIKFADDADPNIKLLNDSGQIRYPVTINGELTHAQRLSIIIQAIIEMGLITDVKIESSLLSAKKLLFNYLKCLESIYESKKSLTGLFYIKSFIKILKNSLWDDKSPRMTTQIRGIGQVYSQRLYSGGIRSYAELQTLSSARLKEILKIRSDKIYNTIMSLPMYSGIFTKSDDKYTFVYSNRSFSEETSTYNTEILIGDLSTDRIIIRGIVEQSKKELFNFLYSGDPSNLVAYIFNSSYIGPDMILKCKIK